MTIFINISYKNKTEGREKIFILFSWSPFTPQISTTHSYSISQPTSSQAMKEVSNGSLPVRKSLLGIFQMLCTVLDRVGDQQQIQALQLITIHL